MRQPESHQGTWLWLGLGAYVGVADYYGRESLTHAFERAREHPLGRIVALGGLAVTAAHLLDLIPHQYDPFYLALELKHERPVANDN